jgi:drug/metabolite transporter (DMT)-like permease
MSLKVAAILVVAVISGGVGDTLMSKGMKQIGPIGPADLASPGRLVIRVLRQPFVLLGTLCMAVYFFSFLTALSWADVSVVVPIAASSILLTTLLAQQHLGEDVSPLRWLGALLIVGGVALVARSAAGSGAQPP